MGFAMMFNQNILIGNNFKDKVYNAMQMIALCCYAGKLGYLKESNNKLATTVALLPGIALGIRRIMQFRKM